MALASLVAKVKLDGVSNVVGGLRQVRAGIRQVAEVAGEARQKAAAFGASLRDMVRQAGAISTVATAASAAIGGGLGLAAFNAARDMDGLTRGLATVSKDANDLQGQLSRLQQIAALPGLSLEQAISGSLALQSAGLSANLAERALKGFGNALASVGKGSSELEGVITALSQIQSKGVVSAEEINQIAERVPQIRTLLKGAFGTSDTQEIQKLGLTAKQAIEGIVAQAERLPAVSGGIGNLVENLGDRIQRALLPLGRGIAAGLEAISPAIERIIGRAEQLGERIGQFIAALGNSGVLTEVLDRFSAGFDRLTQSVGGGGDFLERFVAGALAFAANLPDTLSALASNTVQIFQFLGDQIDLALDRIELRFTGMIATLMAKLEGFGNRAAAIFGGNIWEIPGRLRDANAAEDARIAGIQAGSALGNAAINSRGSLALRLAPVTPFAGADEFLQRIRGATKPIPAIPSGLTFGAGAGASESAPKTEDSPIEKILAEIERNTKSAADSLSLRAQTLGGGDLARAGVTPQELRGAGVSGFAPRSAEYPNRPASTDLESIYRRIVREEQRKAFGRGRIN